MDTGMLRAIDQLVKMGAVPDLKDEDTGRHDHHAILMGLVVGRRPSVNRFARVMDEQLRANDRKGWWRQAAPGHCLAESGMISWN